MFDLTEVKYIKRITVGSDNPARMNTPEEIEAATALLNKCLSGTPKGCIMATEKSFVVRRHGVYRKKPAGPFS